MDSFPDRIHLTLSFYFVRNVVSVDLSTKCHFFKWSNIVLSNYHCFIHPISWWMNMACHLTACVNFSFYFDQGQTFSSNIYSSLDQSRRQNKVFDSLAGVLKSLT